MQAASYLGDRDVDLVDVRVMNPQDGFVQIRVAYCGLCGTDLHIFHGNMDGRVTRPLVFGHEMSGTIEEVGNAVQGWAAGDRVTVMPLIWDDVCPACLAGHQHICQNLTFVGIDSPGALQPLWNVPAELLVALPNEVSLDVAALAEPVSVAVHDVRRAGVGKGDRVVVIGGGPIGVLIATVAAHEGADLLLAEVDAKRRAQIEQLGITTVDPRETDVAAEVQRWTNGAGADICFEVSGSAAAAMMSTSVVKVRGTVVIVAIHAVPPQMNLQQVFWKELRILGARVYERRDFESSLQLLGSGAIPSQALVSAILPLREVKAGLELLEFGGAMKVMIDVQSEGFVE